MLFQTLIRIKSKKLFFSFWNLNCRHYFFEFHGPVVLEIKFFKISYSFAMDGLRNNIARGKDLEEKCDCLIQISCQTFCLFEKTVLLRYNSRIIQLTWLKCTMWQFFGTFRVVQPSLQSNTFLLSQKETLCPESSPPSSPAPGNH